LAQEIPEIHTEEIPGLSLDRNECFDGRSLWGYMNGGADIYLEYGFEKLRVEEFTKEDETIKLEVFKMDDPISAFGIYSFKTFRCEQSNVIIPIDCLNRFQFQLLCGSYYIQIINESGSEKAKQTMIMLAETLLKKIEPYELKLPVKYLTDSLNFSLSEIKMVKGELGVHNKTNYLKDCFSGIDNYEIYFAKTDADDKKVKYYELVFDAPEMKNKFLDNMKDKEFLMIKEAEDRILIQQ
jgi:hypothetical protein